MLILSSNERQIYVHKCAYIYIYIYILITFLIMIVIMCVYIYIYTHISIYLYERLAVLGEVQGEAEVRVAEDRAVLLSVIES